MIDIVYYRDHCKVTVDGHAGTAPEGEDLVCAAVSALVYTVAANACNLQSIGAVRDADVEMHKGHSEIRLYPRNKYKGTCTMIMDSIIAGMEVLASQYPQAIRFQKHG